MEECFHGIDKWTNRWFVLWQPPPDDDVPAVQADGGGLRLHPPRVQVVQLRGDLTVGFAVVATGGPGCLGSG